MTRLSPEQKKLILNPPNDAQPLDLDSNTCFACMRKFKNSRGLTIHSKHCKGERAEEAKIKGLEPMFLKWVCENGQSLNLFGKKMWRDMIRVWVLKRVKLELNLGISSHNPSDINMADDSTLRAALVSAGRTVIPCLIGDHSNCAVHSSGCGGDHAAPDYSELPSQRPLHLVPAQTVQWLKSVVDAILGLDALKTLVVNGRKATTSLVESVHRQIRGPIAKGHIHRKNETRLIKSGKMIR